MNWSKEWKTPSVWPEVKQIGWDLGAKEGDKLTVAIIKNGEIIDVKEGDEAREFIKGQAESVTITYPSTSEFPPVQFDGMMTVELDKAGNITEENRTKLLKDINDKIPTGWAGNLKPTHDPYTNPNAYLYYECACGARLDPHVKSFAALNNVAMNSEWKIRFGHDGYVPYCPKCGEGVE